MLRKPICLIIIALSLLWSVHSLAATEFIVTINKTGQDYDTFALAENALDNAGDLTDGTVKCGSWDACSGTCTSATMLDSEAVTWDGGDSGGTLIHLTATQYCIDVTSGSLADDDIVNDGESNIITINGTPDSCQITMAAYDDDGVYTANEFQINGFTTSAENYVKITAPVGERHSGVLSSGASGTGFRWNVIDSRQYGINMLDNYAVLEWIQLRHHISTTYRAAILTSNTGVIIQNNIVSGLDDEGNPTTATAVNGIATSGAGNRIYNNIVYGFKSGSGISASTETSEVFNNTVYLNLTGILANNTETVIAKNNLACDNVGVDAWLRDYRVAGTTSDQFAADSTHNLSCDDSAPELNTYYLNKTISFISKVAGSENLHLKSTDTDAIDKGTDLGNGLFDTDIDGRDRDTAGDTWDVGADEYVASSGPKKGAIMRPMIILQ